MLEKQFDVGCFWDASGACEVRLGYSIQYPQARLQRRVELYEASVADDIWHGTQAMKEVNLFWR
jgi:hypothetical protein